jgi:hypothetical protein
LEATAACSSIFYPGVNFLPSLGTKDKPTIL